ncbi:hypothetical protein ANCCAN_29447 [Ancylostoma caninum]|uniref:Uncharacterized protein n=1 Tax=Ancylostoma caninum TaxID=29170 RepID=A0A368EZN8_ANCCA|nr:hypothetical protein ANCCAN_29447 [Ancylostoma caninum]
MVSDLICNGMKKLVDNRNKLVLDFVVDVCDPPDRLALGAAVLKCMKTVADNVRRQTNTDPSHEQDDTASSSNPRKRKIPPQMAGTYQSATIAQVQSDEGLGMYNAQGME